MIKGVDESIFRQWIEESLRTNTHILAAGYQGKTLLYEDESQRIVVKTPHGKGIVRYIHTLLLRHEYTVYQKLADIDGVAECYGLVDNQYLALEFINGAPIRNKRPKNEEKFHEALFNLIHNMHQAGVAHMDLKKKDNLLITTEDQPCIIDFGVAVIKKKGFHPVNAYLYRLAKRFDYNAWIKHKYHNRNIISDADALYYKRTCIERISSRAKKLYSKLNP